MGFCISMISVGKVLSDKQLTLWLEHTCQLSWAGRFASRPQHERQAVHEMRRRM